MVEFFFLDLETSLVNLCFLGCKEYTGPVDCFFGRMIGSIAAAIEERPDETGG